MNENSVSRELFFFPAKNSSIISGLLPSYLFINILEEKMCGSIIFLKYNNGILTRFQVGILTRALNFESN